MSDHQPSKYDDLAIAWFKMVYILLSNDEQIFIIDLFNERNE